MAINYEKKLIHVYHVKQVSYKEGFERYKDNMQLIENWWLTEYLVGATRTEMEEYMRPSGYEMERVNRELERIE